ncbi:hypothetical protein FRB96_008956 [Tulasnella sp. 330]|nr:hypothetical protein FRB96_008956 [Tulasnella sp. 330]
MSKSSRHIATATIRPNVRLNNLQAKKKLTFTTDESSTGPVHEQVWTVTVTITSLDPVLKVKLPSPLSAYSYTGTGRKIGDALNNASYFALEALDQLWDNPPQRS